MAKVLVFRRPSQRAAHVVCLRCREVTTGEHRCEPLEFVAPVKPAWEPPLWAMCVGYGAVMAGIVWAALRALE